MANDRNLIPANHAVFEDLEKKIKNKCAAKGFAVSSMTLSFLANSARFRFNATSPLKTVFPITITAREESPRLIIITVDVNYRTDDRSGRSKAPRSLWARTLNIGDEYGDSVELPTDMTMLERTVIVALDDVLAVTQKRMVPLEAKRKAA
jgi:hypothetical protein